MFSNDKMDIRLVYLAIHHIIKYRGNFLYTNDINIENINSKDKLKELFELLNEKDFLDINENIINELNYIEGKVCKILGKSVFKNINTIDMAKMRLQKMEKVEIPKKAVKKKVKTITNKKDSNKKLLSDLESLF